MRHILIVGGYLGMHRELYNQGLRLTLLTNKQKLKEDTFKMYERVIGVKNNAPEMEFLNAAKFIHSIDPIDMVISFTDNFIELAANIANKLNLNFINDIDTVEAACNKLKMRQIINKASLNSTDFKIVSDFSQLETFINEVDYPVVVKPQKGTASIGINILRNEKDLIKFRLETGNLNKPTYIEKFIHGEEFSVEAFSENGVHKVICVTQKHTNEKHVEIGHCIPAPIENHIRKSIITYVKNVLNALKVKNGPTHTEVILSKNGPVLIETHTRFPGDNIPELIELVTGTNLFKLFAEQISGKEVLTKIPIIQTNDLYAAIWYKTSNMNGKIIDIDYKCHNKTIYDIPNLHVSCKKEENITETIDSFTRLAYAITKGSNATNTLTEAKSIINNLIVKVD
ncbi:ATP-grasp domain-containing protein [Bacillus cereus]|uniref:ATP-grasp domain-containing protein n=1 Tax=Bacillus cereus TaxID=1396 RepID=A0A9X8IVV9_BACCE|nr:ATP-grasp domain-containing protein [Bacillus cereus]RWQ71088.1 ATP-grasp domain-containing protein [Bacillus cereus]